MITLVDLVSWVVAAVFVWAGGLNLVGPGFIRDEFESWNYPPWLRTSVGVLEGLAAILLVWPRFRLIGCLVAMIVLLGVIITLLRDRQLMRLEYPLVLLALAAIIAISAAGLSVR
jgi:uncharacterized membrane protein YphA (DoxX/SURF4 family)